MKAGGIKVRGMWVNRDARLPRHEPRFKVIHNERPVFRCSISPAPRPKLFGVLFAAQHDDSQE